MLLFRAAADVCLFTLRRLLCHDAMPPCRHAADAVMLMLPCRLFCRRLIIFDIAAAVAYDVRLAHIRPCHAADAIYKG